MNAKVGSATATARPVGRPPIPTGRIVAAALAVIDDGGAEALSMRAVAQRLRSSTATLYRHFPDRGGLIDAVIDHIIGEIDLDFDEIRGGDWKVACRKIAVDYFEALGRHRGVALALADRTPTGPNAAAVREAWLALLLGAGFPVDLAVRSGAMMSSYVQGYAIQYAGERVAGDLDADRIPAALAKLDAADFPAIATVIAAQALPVPLEEEFIFGLDLLIEGLERLHEQQRV